MTLTTIVNALAKNVGLATTDQVVGSTRREWMEAVSLSNATGEELARRVDWGQLQKNVTLTGDGTDKLHDLGEYFSRLGAGICILTSTGIARALSRAEWASLTPMEGVPRYFLLEDKTVRFWPYLANGETVTANTQSAAWCSNGTDKWASDDDESLIDEDLHVKGLIVRWRRQKGMDYADYEAEYEAAIRDFASFTDRART